MGWIASSIRADCAARLRAWPPLAGWNVETSRASAISDALMPFLAVYTDVQESPLQSVAGTEPRFDTSLHLSVEPKLQGSPASQAEMLLDAVIGEVLDGLLSDPAWLAAQNITKCASFSVQTKVSNEGSAYTALGRITFVLAYTERYPPRLGGPITFVDLTEQVGTQQLGAAIVIPTS